MTDKPPFIVSQGMRLLTETEHPARFLRAEYFRSRRPGATPSGEMAGGGPGDDCWIAIDREDVALGGVELSGRETCSLRRLVITTDAGIGKSVNMQWLNRRLNQPGSRTMSLLIEPQSLLEEPNDWLALLAGLIPAPRAKRDGCRCLVERLRSQGRLAILFDALDQASVGTVRRLGQFLQPPWNDCRLVISGRPHALQRYWDLLFRDRPQWRFVQVDEFTPTEQRRFLGKVEPPQAEQAPGSHVPKPVPVSAVGQDRIDLIPEETREILSVPRVLEYLRRIPANRLSWIVTASDVYWEAIQYMVSLGMKNSTQARRFGLLPGEAAAEEITESQFARVIRMLGAIAFQITFPETRPATQSEAKYMEAATRQPAN